MGYIVGFFRFWYDFLVGDDWRIAAGIVATLILAAVIAHKGSPMAAGAVLVLGVLLTGAVALSTLAGVSETG